MKLGVVHGFREKRLRPVALTMSILMHNGRDIMNSSEAGAVAMPTILAPQNVTAHRSQPLNVSIVVTMICRVDTPAVRAA